MTKQKEPKKYYLSDEELRNVTSRKSLIEEYTHVNRLLKQDLEGYMVAVVGKRIGLKDDEAMHLSSDSKYVEVHKNAKPAQTK